MMRIRARLYLLSTIADTETVGSLTACPRPQVEPQAHRTTAVNVIGSCRWTFSEG